MVEDTRPADEVVEAVIISGPFKGAIVPSEAEPMLDEAIGIAQDIERIFAEMRHDSELWRIQCEQMKAERREILDRIDRT